MMADSLLTVIGKSVPTRICAYRYTVMLVLSLGPKAKIQVLSPGRCAQVLGLDLGLDGGPWPLIEAIKCLHQSVYCYWCTTAHDSRLILMLTVLIKFRTFMTTYLQYFYCHQEDFEPSGCLSACLLLLPTCSGRASSFSKKSGLIVRTQRAKMSDELLDSLAFASECSGLL